MSIENPFTVEKSTAPIIPAYDYKPVIDAIDALNIGEAVTITLQNVHRGFGQSFYQLTAAKYGIARRFKCRTIKSAGVAKFLKWEIVRVDTESPKEANVESI